MGSSLQPLEWIGYNQGRFVDSHAAGLRIIQEWKAYPGRFERLAEESGTIIVYTRKPLTTRLEYELYDHIDKTSFYAGYEHDLCWNEVCVQEDCGLFVRSFFKPQEIANGYLRGVVPEGPSDIGSLHPRWRYLLHDNGHRQWRNKLCDKVTTFGRKHINRQSGTELMQQQMDTALVMLLATSWITGNTTRYNPEYKTLLKEMGFGDCQRSVLGCLWTTNEEGQMLLCLFAVLAIYDIEKPTHKKLARPGISISMFLISGQIEVSDYVPQQILRSFLRTWSVRPCRPDQRWFGTFVQRSTPLDTPYDCDAANSYWTSRLHYFETHEDATRQLATRRMNTPASYTLHFGKNRLSNRAIAFGHMREQQAYTRWYMLSRDGV